MGYYVTSINVLNSGTRIVTTDNTLYRRQYSLSTAYDVSTASIIGSVIFPPTLERRLLGFSPDGVNMYGQSSGSEIYHYVLSSAYDISTAVLQSGTFNAGAANWQGFDFKPDGTAFFGGEYVNDAVDRYLYTGT